MSDNKSFDEILDEAIKFATIKHKGQTRKDNTPYIKHPLSVSLNVLTYYDGDDLETVLISSLLHDTLEDTTATNEEIVTKFGDKVYQMVTELTSDKAVQNTIGKEKYLSIKMTNMSEDALTVKLCDRLDNVCDLVNTDNTNFRDRYINETYGIINYLLDNRVLSSSQLILLKEIITNLLILSKDRKIARLSKIFSSLGYEPSYQNKSYYDKILKKKNNYQ